MLSTSNILDTQLTIALKVGLTEEKEILKVLKEVDEMQGILVATINKVKN